ncbi:MarR family transcriptional regulator [Chitinophaga sedimenti]|uniref:MarR family winged helix-turn-helix transcriptional regulator n=1 Tax=Chitinophaga sedimenti TaxID=2033606 RepID=UPI00200376EE|nr:helix-turn-helix domain-containing protein [Chitinophaga sedimenti]MCK7556867.1 MarR family transcriptional regulator [Chitinophaga sedimenti]
MSFYPSLGYLIFGTRLRRLSEYFLAEVNKVYEYEGIAFDASWFPVFYLMSQRPALTLQDIATELEVSHSAISQLIAGLKKKGLVKTEKCEEDGRRQRVAFTVKGKALLAKVQPIWKAIAVCMQAVSEADARSKQLLDGLAGLEASLDKQSLSDRIFKELEK